MASKAAREAEKAEAIASLRETLKPGDTVHTILRHVSRSGMLRCIDLVKPEADGRFSYLTVLTARAFGEDVRRRDGSWRVENGRGIPTTGCGMDMGFSLVSNLSAILYPDGFGCIGQGCPSNDHCNGDWDYTPHGNGHDLTRREVLIGADHWHRSGDYALRQRWI